MRRKATNYPGGSKPLRKPVKHSGLSQTPEKTEEALNDAIHRLRNEVGELIDMERAAIRIELKHKAIELRESSLWWATGGVLCVLGALCIALSGLLVFASFMPLWVAALLVGVFLMALGAIAFRGRVKARRVRASRGRGSVEVAAL